MRINIIRKMLCFSPVGVVSRGVGVGEVDEMHVDGTRGCAGAVAVQKDIDGFNRVFHPTRKSE